MASSVFVESDLRSDFRMRWSGWLETYEHARGGGAGIPDVQILVDRLLVPIELKRAELVGNRLFSDTIRPAQISWHFRFQESGGLSFFMFGMVVGGRINHYLAPALVVKEHRTTGLILEKHCFKISASERVNREDHMFTESLVRIILTSGAFQNKKSGA
jgi:hypothetical protein